MDAFTVHVTSTGKINDNNFYHYEKGELYVGVTGQLYGLGSAVLLETKRIAERYKDAITTRRLNAGDGEFEATVEKITSSGALFEEKVKVHSEKVTDKLKKWGVLSFKKPSNSGWLILIKHKELGDNFYLLSYGKKGKFKMTNEKAKAKLYKKRAFALNAVDEINKIEKCQAIAVELT